MNSFSTPDVITSSQGEAIFSFNLLCEHVYFLCSSLSSPRNIQNSEKYNVKYKVKHFDILDLAPLSSMRLNSYFPQNVTFYTEISRTRNFELPTFLTNAR